MTVSPSTLRELMRGVPAPVGVIVTASSTGYRGMTASSMTSVCLDPPLISFNVRIGSQFERALGTANAFTYNLLAADQRETAARFAASGMSAEAQFEGVAVNRDDLGAVWLDGVVSWMHCARVARHVAGDHAVIIGEVVAAARVNATAPLIIYQGTLRAVDEP